MPVNRLLFGLTIALWLLIGSPYAAAENRPFTLDDMLKVEGIGAAVHDPNGRWFVFEKIRPYDEITDYSFRTYAFAKSGHQLWRYDLIDGGAPELLPGIGAETHSYLQAFSPEGTFLAFVQYHLGSLSLGAYEMSAERAKRSTRTPAFSRTGDHNPVWVSEDEIVFSALPADIKPAATSVRAFTGEVLTAAWRAAWRGDTVTANEVRTIPKDESDIQEAGELVLFNARTGAEHILSTGLFVDLRASPDRNFLAALSVSKPRAYDRTASAQFDPRRYALTLFSLETGQSNKIADHLEVFPYTLTWSPDSERVAFFAWPAGSNPQHGRFYVLHIKSGELTAFEHEGLDLASERERGYLQRPERTAFLGDALAVFARKIPESENQSPRFSLQTVRPDHTVRAAWYALSADGGSRDLTSDLTGVSGIPIHAGDGHFVISADDGAYRIYTDGSRLRLTPDLPGKLNFIPQGTFSTRAGVIRPDFPQHALFNIRHGTETHFVVVEFGDDAAPPRPVVSTTGRDAQALAAMPGSGAVLVRAEDGLISRILLFDETRGGGPLEIDRINVHLSDIDFGSWHRVSYEVGPRGSDSPLETVVSCILLPPGYKPGDQLALIVDAYPSRRPRCDEEERKIPYTDPHSPYLWAGMGYAYTRMSTPRSLIRTDDGPIAGMDEVIVAGVDALVSEGFIDPNRIALHGFSQGGISALFVAAHSDRFKAVIAKNGWANMFSHYFGGAGVYAYLFDAFGDFMRYEAVEASDFGIGRTPFEDPDVFVRNSPVFLAPHIDAPVLLFHSDMDSFGITQFDEMFGALLRAGKDARYVRYWGEGHGPSSPANIRDMWDRMEEFLAEHGLAPD